MKNKVGAAIGAFLGAAFLYVLVAFATWNAVLNFGEWSSEQRVYYFLITFLLAALGGAMGDEYD